MRIIGVAFLLAATPVEAGPWVQEAGRSQVIIKHEDIEASESFDDWGDRVALPGRRIDRSLGVFAEYGLTDQVTLQIKGDWQDGEDPAFSYEGRGPVEVGATVQVWRNAQTAISVYGGYADGGEGRNAGYAAPGVGKSDWEVRTSLGHSFAGTGRWSPDRSFVDIQVARRMRDGLPDETRADFTLGAHFGDKWLMLGQAFGGIANGDNARWLLLETSIVRHLGAWSLQGGWRQSVAGRNTPVANGPVVALWRRF